MSRENLPSAAAETPLQLSHPVECWVHSSEEAARGLFQILTAINEQQGSDWRKSRRRTNAARRHFRRAAFWAREGLKNPIKGGGDHSPPKSK